MLRGWTWCAGQGEDTTARRWTCHGFAAIVGELIVSALGAAPRRGASSIPSVKAEGRRDETEGGGLEGEDGSDLAGVKPPPLAARFHGVGAGAGADEDPNYDEGDDQEQDGDVVTITCTGCASPSA